jgi:AcrR family transcriptional regulator
LARATSGLREQKKAQTRRAIQETALRLFMAQGYEATTVEQIAAEVGISHMTFFRYFPTKESVVQDDDYDPRLEELIVARPAAETPMEAVHHGVVAAIREIYAADRDLILERSRLLLSTPALRSRLPLDQAGSGEALVRALATRSGGEVTLEARVIAAAAISALVTAIAVWVERDGAEELPDILDQAFAALRVS